MSEYFWLNTKIVKIVAGLNLTWYFLIPPTGKILSEGFQIWISVPVGLPSITARRFPSLFISKTIIGILFSRHMVKAVRSIIFRPLL
jgi:hypothetical protein